MQAQQQQQQDQQLPPGYSTAPRAMPEGYPGAPSSSRQPNANAPGPANSATILNDAKETAHDVDCPFDVWVHASTEESWGGLFFRESFVEHEFVRFFLRSKNISVGSAITLAVVAFLNRESDQSRSIDDEKNRWAQLVHFILSLVMILVLIGMAYLSRSDTGLFNSHVQLSWSRRNSYYRLMELMLFCLGAIHVVGLAAVTLIFKQVCKTAEGRDTQANIACNHRIEPWPLVYLCLITVWSPPRFAFLVITISISAALQCYVLWYTGRGWVSVQQRVAGIIIVLGVHLGITIVTRIAELRSRLQYKLLLDLLQLTLKSAHEQKLLDVILQNVLPETVLNRMIQGKLHADRVEAASVLYSDVVMFTKWSSTRSAEEVVSMLSVLVSAFDARSNEFGVEKIKTIGDGYWAVCGIPDEIPDHALRMCGFALSVQSFVSSANALHPEWGGNLQVRIGIHTGPLVGGVVGIDQLSYEVFGTTNVLASEAEQNANPGGVLVTEPTFEQVKTVMDGVPHHPVHADSGNGSLYSFNTFHISFPEDDDDEDEGNATAADGVVEQEREGAPLVIADVMGDAHDVDHNRGAVLRHRAQLRDMLRDVNDGVTSNTGSSQALNRMSSMQIKKGTYDDFTRVAGHDGFLARRAFVSRFIPDDHLSSRSGSVSTRSNTIRATSDVVDALRSLTQSATSETEVVEMAVVPQHGEGSTDEPGRIPSMNPLAVAAVPTVTVDVDEVPTDDMAEQQPQFESPSSVSPGLLGIQDSTNVASQSSSGNYSKTPRSRSARELSISSRNSRASYDASVGDSAVDEARLVSDSLAKAELDAHNRVTKKGSPNTEAQELLPPPPEMVVSVFNILFRRFPKDLEEDYHSFATSTHVTQIKGGAQDLVVYSLALLIAVMLETWWPVSIVCCAVSLLLSIDWAYIMTHRYCDYRAVIYNSVFPLLLTFGLASGPQTYANGSLVYIRVIFGWFVFSRPATGAPRLFAQDAALVIIPNVIATQFLIDDRDPTWTYAFELNITTVAVWTSIVYKEYLSRMHYLAKKHVDEAKASIESDIEARDKLFKTLVPVHVTQSVWQWIMDGKDCTKPINHMIPRVCVAFFKVLGLVTGQSLLSPATLHQAMHQLFSDLESVVVKSEQICKIKTVGDLIILAGPLEDHDPSHEAVVQAAEECAVVCTKMRRLVSTFLSRNQELAANLSAVRDGPSDPTAEGATSEELEASNYGSTFASKTGLSYGPVLAGVLGTTRIAYDLFGTTLNLASRLMSTGEEGDISVSPEFYDLLAPQLHYSVSTIASPLVHRLDPDTGAPVTFASISSLPPEAIARNNGSIDDNSHSAAEPAALDHQPPALVRQSTGLSAIRSANGHLMEFVFTEPEQRFLKGLGDVSVRKLIAAPNVLRAGSIHSGDLISQ